MADLLKKHGEDRILSVMQAWEKKCEWQRNRYHTRLKPKYQEEKKRLHDLQMQERERKGQIPA